MGDESGPIERKFPQPIHATALAQTVAAAVVALAAVGPVAGNRAVRDADRGAAGDIDATSESIAAVLAAAADRRIVVKCAIADRGRPAQGRQAAAPNVAAAA